MAKRMSTFRRKTRFKLQKAKSKRGKISFRSYLSEYNAVERVILKTEPAIQEGFFHPKYQGRVGLVGKKQGSCYEVTINDFGKEKKLIIHPVHLKRC